MPPASVRRVAVGAGLLLAAAGCALASRATQTRSAPVPAPARSGGRGPSLAVPLWSARRMPDALARAIARARLDGQLDALLSGTHACIVARRGEVAVAERDATIPLAAASSQKLLVAAAALAVLGPDFRFETRLVARSEPRDGTVGELWLVGAGDPLLATPEYEAFLATQKLARDRPVTAMAGLADALAAAGVHAVQGPVHGDDSRYDRTRYLPTWKPVYLSDHEIGPLGALTVNDGFSAWRPKTIAAGDPATYAAAEFVRLASARGITVAGPADSATAPAGAKVVARVRSVPLREVVADMLRESNNLSAELLVREVGVRVGHEGSTPAGTAVVAGELAKLGLPTDGLHLVDGSGLDTANRVTCRLLFAALDLGSRAQFRPIWDGLAVAGQSGTLVNRLIGTPLEGHLRAKTGSIEGVVGLTGFVDGAATVEFAFVADGTFGERAGRALQDAVAGALLRWPDAPVPDSLAPPAGPAGN